MKVTIIFADGRHAVFNCDDYFIEYEPYRIEFFNSSEECIGQLNLAVVAGYIEEGSMNVKMSR